MDRFKSRIPRYTADDSDYTTNAPSYYDDLARKEKLIRVLAERIGYYDEELAKRFEEWDKNLEELPDELKRMFLEWVDDGTLARILAQLLLDEYATIEWVLELFGTFKDDINKDLDDFKEEINDEMEKIRELENLFDLREIEPMYMFEAGAVRDAVNQSIAVDTQTNNIYVTQAYAGGGIGEGFFITKLTPSGKYISAMYIEKGGHGTSIGIERTTSGILKIWSYHTSLRKLISFPYKDNHVFKESEADGYPDYMPLSLQGQYNSVICDDNNGNIVFRMSDGEINIYKLLDIMKNDDNRLYSFKVEAYVNSGENPMQGMALDDKDFYWLSGAGRVSDPIYIQKYNIETGKKEYELIEKRLTHRLGINVPDDGLQEPEGLFLYINPITKKKTLLMVISVGGGNKRLQTVYGYHQPRAHSHWTSMLTTGSQNYALTKGDGRALSIPDGTTDLLDINRPGTYYLSGKETNDLKGLPYSYNGSSCYIIIEPTQASQSTIQTVIRRSTSKKIFIVTRAINFDQQTLTWSGGNWTVINTLSEEQEHLRASDYDYNLYNLTLPGQYYLTGAQSEAFNDIPSQLNGIGYYVEISSGSNSGNILQTLTRFSEDVYEVLTRNVHTKTNKAEKWKQFKPEITIID